MVLAPTLSLALLLGGPSAKAARANAVLTRVKPSQVVEMLEAQQLKVEQVVDEAGDPQLNVKSEELDYQVLFYDCNEEGCAELQLRTWWPANPKVTATLLSEHTRTHRVGRYYLEASQAPHFELLVPLAGGVTLAHIQAQHAQYRSSAQIFAGKLPKP